MPAAHGDVHPAPAHASHGHGEHVPQESPAVMLIPLAVLALGALVAGVVFKGAFIGEGFEAFWKGALFQGADEPHPRRNGTGPGAGQRCCRR